jgi:membrane fusion protein, multidrug efflux system
MKNNLQKTIGWGSLLLSFYVLGQSGTITLEKVSPRLADVSRWVQQPAFAQPWQEAHLIAKVSGYIKEIMVDRGSEVKAGDVLIVIDIPELLVELKKQEAQLKAARLELERLKKAILQTQDLILPQRVEEAEVKVEMIQADIDKTKLAIQYSEVKAPFNGIISERQQDLGAYITAGQTSLLTLQDTHKLRFITGITEQDSLRIRNELPVKLQIVGADSNEVIAAKISRVSSGLDPITRTITTEIDIENSNKKYAAGIYAQAQVAVDQHRQVMCVPAAALVTEKQSAYLFLYKEGKAVKTSVQPGFNDGTYVEINSLKQEDQVLLPGGQTLTDGQSVGLK